MPTRVYAAFGVYGRPSADEREVLELADAFRRELADLLHAKHCDVVDYRDDRFPALWEAMTEHEHYDVVIFEIERRIKAYHSEVRDRNAVTAEQTTALLAARERKQYWYEQLRARRTAWYAHLTAFRAWWAAAADWKNIKSLDRRRSVYAELTPPAEFADYCALHIHYDLAEREIYRRYQELGLHSAIRAEIVEATQPKIGLTGPGMRYFYGNRRPRPRPWRKLLLQFSGGVTWQAVLDGDVPGLSAVPVYTNHPAGGDETVYRITQQIGTSAIPRVVDYTMKLDKPMPPTAIIQRWTLTIDGDRRTVMPIVKNVAPKRQATADVFRYKLRWTVRPDGVEIAEFRGAHVRETLVLPAWLVAKRMALYDAQCDCDNQANDLLETRGISRSKRPGSRHGVVALGDYCREHPTDTAAGNVLDELQRRLRHATRMADSATRCISDIYRSSAAKICRLHAAVRHDNIKLDQIKRYDTRDLLREDVLTKRSRKLLFAVAPGKLREAIKQYGLASTTECPEELDTARNTDLFTSYINELGRTTGTKMQQPCRRSQSDPGADTL